MSINDQTQNVLRPIDKLFLTLIIKNRHGNSADNLEKLMKVMVFITLLNKHQVGNTADNVEKVMKVIVFLTFLNRNGVYNTSDDMEGQGKKKRKAEFLGRLVRFKIAARVGLALNIHKQYRQLMTKQNVFRKNEKLFILCFLKIELTILFIVWKS